LQRALQENGRRIEKAPALKAEWSWTNRRV